MVALINKVTNILFMAINFCFLIGIFYMTINTQGHIRLAGAVVWTIPSSFTLYANSKSFQSEFHPDFQISFV